LSGGGAPGYGVAWSTEKKRARGGDIGGKTMKIEGRREGGQTLSYTVRYASDQTRIAASRKGRGKFRSKGEEKAL